MPASALGLDVREATLAELVAAGDEPFDAVVLADVIEHLDDPVGAVRDCARLLAPGGVACFVTPDPASRTARVAGARWWAYLPAHTYLLPRMTLRALLAREGGLEPVADVGLRRTFTLGYWFGGLGERSGLVGRATALVRRLPLARRPLTLSLGDERVVVAAKAPGAGASQPGDRGRRLRGVSGPAEGGRRDRSDVRRVATSTAAGLVGRVAVLGLGLVSVAVTTRYLGPGGYGQFALALAFTQLFGVLADAGLTTIVIRELAQRPERAPAVVGSALALRGVLAVLAVAAAGLVSLAMPYPPDVRVAVLIAGVPLVLGMLNSAFVAVLLADLRMGRVAIADVAGRAAGLLAVVVVVALDLGFYAVVAAGGVGAAVALAATTALARPLLPARPRGDRATSRRLMTAALPLGLALALNEVYFRADALIISLSRPFAELGLYALAWRIGEVVATVPAVFLLSVFPVLARYAATRDRRLGPALQVAGDVAVLTGVGIAAGGAVVAGELARLLGGEAFAAAATPLRVLLAASALGFLNGVFGHALIARRPAGGHAVAERRRPHAQRGPERRARARRRASRPRRGSRSAARR